MFNKVLLLGNLGQDAQVKGTEGEGAKLTVLSVATNRTWKNADGERQNATDWHRVIAFGPSAEFAARLKKGQQVHVEGRLQTRTWDDNGSTRYVTEVVTERILRVGRPIEDADPEEASPED